MISQLNEDTIFAPHPQLRDDLWLCEGGRVADWLRLRRPGPVRIDFSRLGWADPAPLLALSALCCEYRTRGGLVTIDLGFQRPLDNRFLIFLSQHGFLSTLGAGSDFLWKSNRYTGEEIKALTRELNALPGVLSYQDSECIQATALSTTDLGPNEVEKVVDRLLYAAKPRVVSWLSNNTRRLNLIMYQLRLFLLEALDNVAEHAYGDQNGFCAVYGRIRSGSPDGGRGYEAWKHARFDEAQHCPALERSETGKRPGWLELFISDVGVGLHHKLNTISKDPLKELSSRLFREPVSCHADRAVSGKTSITGLQRMGELLMAGAKLHGRGDFIRIYSAGEWIGDHLPWPEKGLEAGHKNARTIAKAQPPPGVTLHYSIEPAPAEAQSQLSFYPSHFFAPTAEDLQNVRSALARLESPPHADYDFVDLFISEDAPQPRSLRARQWIHQLSTKTLILRPSIRQRKGVFIGQLRNMIEQNPRLETVIFADVPWSAAIDFSNIIAFQTRLYSAPRNRITLLIVSQDWRCAGFTSSNSPMAFKVDPEAARFFFHAADREPSAAMVARALRQRDSELFWQALGPAYLNEPLLWTSAPPQVLEQEIWGYLDTPLALSNRDSYAAARRSLRRAVSSFAHETVYVGDELVLPLLAGEFIVEDVESGVSKTKEPGVLVGSVLGTGSTVQRLLRRVSSGIAGRVQLLQHPELYHAGTADQTPDVIALEWLPPPNQAGRTRTRFSRIPNTPFVIRGGEGSIPLPRFRIPSNNKIGTSLYGEDPATAYKQWERLGILRLGHWVYGLNHDFLTLKLVDAVDIDVVLGGAIARWFTDQLQEWISALRPEQGCLVV